MSDGRPAASRTRTARLRDRARDAAAAACALVAVGALTAACGAQEKPSYRLSTPKTVAGEYQRDGEGSRGDGRAFGDKKVPGMTSDADVGATYKSGPAKKLQLGGAYGTVQSPEKAVRWVLEETGRSLKTGTGAEPKGAARSYSPSSFDGDVLRCREFRISSMSLAVCAWADSSTVGTVSSMILTEDGTKTEPVDLKATAELTAKVREDALVKAKPAD
jgi:hypothetical protein